MIQNHPSEGECKPRRPRWNGLRVLVVDSDGEALDQARQTLAEVGAEVTALADEALVEVELRRGAFQLVVLGVRGGRLDTLTRLRQVDSDVSVVVLTAQPDTDTAIAALKLDVADYLEKPCSPDLLCETVERIARKKGLPTTSDDRVLRVIGDNVRGLRLGAGLTLKQLGARAGLSMSLISQVERGESSPSIGSLHRIAKSLDVGLQDLFRNVDP